MELILNKYSHLQIQREGVAFPTKVSALLQLPVRRGEYIISRNGMHDKHVERSKKNSNRSYVWKRH